MNVGLVADGDAIEAWLTAAQLSGSVNIVAVASGHALARPHIARRFGFPVVESVTDLAAIPNLDGVVIAGPLESRASDALAAEAAKMPIGIAAPLAGNPDDAVEVLKAAPAAIALHTAPWMSGYRIASEALAAGRVGKPGFMRVTYWSSNQEAGGALPGVPIFADLVDHIAAATKLMGDAPVQVYATGQTVRQDVDYIASTITFANGQTAILDLGRAPSGDGPYLAVMVLGRRGAFHFDSNSTAGAMFQTNGVRHVHGVDLAGARAAALRAFAADTTEKVLGISTVDSDIALRTAVAVLASARSRMAVDVRLVRRTAA